MDLTEVMKLIGVIVLFGISIFLIARSSKKDGKYNLLKIVGINVLLCVILTWFIKSGSFNGTAIEIKDITRINITSLLEYGLQAFLYYFTAIAGLLFIIGGFYQVLSNASGYQAVVLGLSKKLKGKETLIVILVSTILATLASVVQEQLVLLVLIPFIVSVLNNTKVDKVSAVATTYGAVLVGIMGSLYSSKITTILTTTFGEVSIYIRLILLVLALIALNVFTILRLKKTSKDKEQESYDVFEVTTSKKNAKKWPYIVMLVLLFLTVILGYMPWNDWKVTIFNSATEWVNGISIGDVPIVSYVFGTFTAFGSWSIYDIQYVLIFATVLIMLFDNHSIDSTLESFGTGVKKYSRQVAIMVGVYIIVILTVLFPVLPTMVDFIVKISSKFNIVLTFISTLLTSLFSVDIQYGVSLTGTYLVSLYGDFASIISFMFQALYGLVMFFAPSSLLLMLGLSNLDVSYKDWVKHIWKFLLVMLIVIIIMIAILQLCIF